MIFIFHVGLFGISLCPTSLRIQVLTSPSTLVKMRGMSMLPQFLLPRLMTPATSYSSLSRSSLTSGPPLSPLQAELPGTPLVAQ